MTNPGETGPLYDQDTYSDFIVKGLAKTFSQVDYLDRGSSNRHMRLMHWEESQRTLLDLTDSESSSERREEARRLSRNRSEALLTHYQQTLTAAGDERGRDLAAIDRFRLTVASIHHDIIFSSQQDQDFQARVGALEQSVDVEDLRSRYWSAIKRWVKGEI